MLSNSCIIPLSTGVESKFGIGVAKMDWAIDQKSWSLISLDGMFLGAFGGLIATDKILAAPGFAHLTGHPPPLGILVSLSINFDDKFLACFISELLCYLVLYDEISSSIVN